MSVVKNNRGNFWIFFNITFIVTMFRGGKGRKDKIIKVERWGKFELKKVSLTGSEFGYGFSCI